MCRDRNGCQNGNKESCGEDHKEGRSQDTELVDFMYEIYDMVVSANYDMERMQKYVDEVSAREQGKCCSGNRKRNVESLAAAREQELLMDEVFGTDQSSAAALTIPTTEKTNMIGYFSYS